MLKLRFYKSQDIRDFIISKFVKPVPVKEQVLKKLCKYLKINIKDSAVLGDWYNDKTLFETDALKIAVANAVPEIKKMADFVTAKSNDEEGVLEFFEMMLKAKS